MGFTLVELMVATMLTGILVLTAGVVLQSSQNVIKRQSALATMQGDLRVALPTLNELIRERSDEDVTVPALTAPPSTTNRFTVGTTNIYRANDAMTYVASGTNLVFARGSSQMVLSKGLVNTFAVTRYTNSVLFVLVLSNVTDSSATVRNDTMTVSNRVYFRN